MIKFRDEIRAGDIVIEKHHRQDDVLLTVTKVTNTHIMCDKNKYNISNGALQEAPLWHPTIIEYASADDILRVKEETKKRGLISSIVNYTWADLSSEELQELVDILPK